LATQTDNAESLNFLAGGLSAVDVNKVERELNRLWAASGTNSGGDGQDAPVIKSCALNFVLLTGAELESQKAADDLLADITTRHPMRAILTVIEEGAPDKIEAFVSARCHLLPGQKGKQLCCEQITVKWSGAKCKGESLASLVTPLVIPDLPSWIFVHGGLPLSEINPFVAYTNHILIDSRSCSNSFTAFKKSIKGLHSLSRDGVVIDLSWRSIKPWRKALAFAFDEEDVNISAQSLGSLRSMVVRHGACGLSQSMYLASWLAQRLGYGFTSLVDGDGQGDLTMVFKGARGEAEPFTVNLKCNADARGINSVELAFYPDQNIAPLKVDFEAGALKVSHEDRAEYVELPYSEDRMDGTTTEDSTIDLLDKVLKVLSQDFVYLDTLFALGTICGDKQ